MSVATQDQDHDSKAHGVATPRDLPAADPHAGEAPGIHASNFRFPAGFLWGGATSSHQV